MTRRVKIATLLGVLMAAAGNQAIVAQAFTSSITVTTTAGRTCTITANASTTSWSNPLDELINYGASMSCDGSPIGVDADASLSDPTNPWPPTGVSCVYALANCPQYQFTPSCNVQDTSNVCTTQYQFVAQRNNTYGYWVHEVGTPGWNVAFPQSEQPYQPHTPPGWSCTMEFIQSHWYLNCRYSGEFQRQLLS